MLNQANVDDKMDSKSVLYFSSSDKCLNKITQSSKMYVSTGQE